MTSSRPMKRHRAPLRLAALAIAVLATSATPSLAQAERSPPRREQAQAAGQAPARVAAAPAHRAAAPPASPAVPSGRGQCVAYVHAHSAFKIQANAHLWWARAAGIHARGSVPEAGSVLSFRSVRGMPLGHVALVSRVVDEREIEIDHNNWLGVGPVRGASVIDVSPRNDWTAVRVANRAGAKVYGRVYPTDGFIHARVPGSEPPMVAARPPGDAPRREPLRAREPG